MKVFGITSTVILSTILVITAPAYAQQGQHDGNKQQDHPDQQQGKREQARSEQPQAQQQQESDRQSEPLQAQQPRQGQNKQRESSRQAQRPDRTQQPQIAQHQRQDQSKPQLQAQRQQRGNEQPRRTQEQQHVQQSAWQQHRAGNWEADHRSWQQRGGYNGYRIPDERFRGYFGPSHGFRIYGLPFLVVGGYPRFQYGGYWFSPVDPWPEYWANNWYDTDNVYVTYADNGYYLFNRRYPNIGIAISISM
jgi:hypothetical protein